MVVPRIAFGVEVLTKNGLMPIKLINTRGGLFSAEDGVKGEIFAITDYKPAPTLKNFLIAIEQWDYYYESSDDPKVYLGGAEYKKALQQLLAQLSEQDKHLIKKIVTIVGL